MPLVTPEQTRDVVQGLALEHAASLSVVLAAGEDALVPDPATTEIADFVRASTFASSVPSIVAALALHGWHVEATYVTAQDPRERNAFGPPLAPTDRGAWIFREVEADGRQA